MTATPLLGFRPRFWPTLWTAIVFASLVALGSWQLQRLSWKVDLIEQRQAGFEAAAIELPHDTDAIEEIIWRRVLVTGEYLHDQEIHLAARSMRGNVGSHILTPFLRSSGEILLINRGWVPRERLDPAARAEGQVTGTVTIEGIATRGSVKGPFSPANDPIKNVWLWVDLAAMEKQVGQPLQRVVVDTLNVPVPGGFPIGGQTRINIANDHLQYAITWYAIAISLILIWFFWHRRRERDEAAE